MTDNDTIHDPNFLDVLRNIYNTSSKKFDKKLPIGLYNSKFHNNPKMLCMKIIFFLFERHVLELVNVLIEKWLKKC